MLRVAAHQLRQRKVAFATQHIGGCRNYYKEYVYSKYDAATGRLLPEDPDDAVIRLALANPPSRRWEDYGGYIKPTYQRQLLKSTVKYRAQKKVVGDLLNYIHFTKGRVDKPY